MVSTLPRLHATPSGWSTVSRLMRFASAGTSTVSLLPRLDAACAGLSTVFPLPRLLPAASAALPVGLIADDPGPGLARGDRIPIALRPSGGLRDNATAVGVPLNSAAAWAASAAARCASMVACAALAHETGRAARPAGQRRSGRRGALRSDAHTAAAARHDAHALPADRHAAFAVRSSRAAHSSAGRMAARSAAEAYTWNAAAAAPSAGS